jgi:hypothetical protein
MVESFLPNPANPLNMEKEKTSKRLITVFWLFMALITLLLIVNVFRAGGVI